jgi:serine/threonine protein kinase
METVGKVKHPNLVPLLGYFVGCNERLFIHEYMENGSLEMWLGKEAIATKALGWPGRPEDQSNISNQTVPNSIGKAF